MIHCGDNVLCEGSLQEVILPQTQWVNIVDNNENDAGSDDDDDTGTHDDDDTGNFSVTLH